jgi:hypothetical protein
MDRIPDAASPPDAPIPPLLLDVTAPDLAPPPVALEPVFPLVIHTSQLVLETTAPGELLAHWHLEADDYLSVGHEFPPAGGVPKPALRLQRLHPDGSSDAAAEVRLALTGIHGDGAREFAVGQDAAQFEVELGLTNDVGGWLLLARSNRSAAAAPSRATPPPAFPVPITPAPPPPTFAPLPAPAEPLECDPHFDPPLTALAPTFPLPERAPRSEPNASAAPVHNAAEATPLIPKLIYGRALSRHTGILIEAELRIYGSGAPNTEIDLLGQRYFIGAGGRFQFLIPVDDTELLTQALLQHPPAQLTCLRSE